MGTYGSSTLEVSEGLGKFKGLDNNSLLLLIVSDLSVSSQWEILSQWMAVESVVGHDSSEIRVANKEDTEQVVNLSFIPVSSIVQAGDRWDWLGLIGVSLDAKTGVMADTEHVVDNLESLVAGWEVNGGNVGNLGVLSGGVVFEEGEDWNDTGRWNVNGELILPDTELLDVFWKSRQKVLSVLMELCSLLIGVVLVGWVDNGNVKLSNSYNSLAEQQIEAVR